MLKTYQDDTARLKLTISYVGTHYHGWQVQTRPSGEEVPTIQQYIEAAVSHVAGVPVHVHGAGRTDSGVHAEAQVAHVDIPSLRTSVDWQLALNTLLPRDIRIHHVELVDRSFHAQFSAKRKTYAYRLWTDIRYTPPFLYPFVWSCGRLNVDSMRAVIPYLVGKRDFASLQNTGTDLLTSVRTLYSIQCTPDISGICEGEKELVWTFTADGFLKQMVRNCMGLLVSAGRGKIHPEDVSSILEAKNRCHAGATAPAQGLVLKSIEY